MFPRFLFPQALTFISLKIDAALVFLGSQLTFILRFFLSRNIVIARDRAWAQTVVSRAKPPDFWQPYVEEWDVPPQVGVTKPGILQNLSQGWVGRMIIRRGQHIFHSDSLPRHEIVYFVVVTIPFAFYPFVGVAISAYIKALGTARYLHKQVKSKLFPLHVFDSLIVKSISKPKR